MTSVFKTTSATLDQAFSNWPTYPPIAPVEKVKLTRDGFLKVENDVLTFSKEKPAEQRLDAIFTHLKAQLNTLDIVNQKDSFTTEQRADLIKQWSEISQIVHKVGCIYSNYCLKRPWYYALLATFFSCFSQVDDSFRAFENLYNNYHVVIQEFQAAQSGVHLTHLKDETFKSAKSLFTLLTTSHTPLTQQSAGVHHVIPPKQPLIRPVAVIKEDLTPLSLVCMPARKLKDKTLPASVRNLNKDHEGVFKFDISAINDKDFGQVYADDILKFFKEKTSPLKSVQLLLDTTRKLTEKEGKFVVALHQIPLLLPSQELDDNGLYRDSKIEVASSSSTPELDWSYDFRLSYIEYVYEGKAAL